MSTTGLKFVAGAGMAIFILVLIGILSVFAFHKLTPIESVVYVIMGLITTLIGMLTALAGHASNSGSKVADSTVQVAAPALPAAAAPTVIVQS